MSQHTHPVKSKRYMLFLTLAALGVVYGDIGTSPLYALRECFHGTYAVPANHENVLGVLSLIIWTMIVVVTIKYVLFVLRADNRGEGGNLALMALALPPRMLAKRAPRKVFFIEVLGLAGASLIYGDGVITPAISVLSAIEGLNVVTPRFEPYVVPITIVVLCGLFLVQRFGTGKVGTVFGPIMVLWFSTIAILGIRGIMMNPAVFGALNPIHGVQFFLVNGHQAFIVLGSVFLVATGAEAMFADMGHFGKRPIQLGWFCLVFPGLFLNYLGQGALILGNPEAAHNPFYNLAPTWMLIPLVVLATAATVIASQALISGAFSLTRQAIQLGFLPRLNIQHTSAREIGQIYIPLVNTLLFIFTVLLVLMFRSSTNLAAAYGIAVSTTMVLTTITIFFVLLDRWRWPLPLVLATIGFFLAVDVLFLSSNMLKVFEGGWIPLVLGLALFTCMTTWRLGRTILRRKLLAITPTLNSFLNEISQKHITRVPGTAIFMTTNIENTPPAMLHNLRHNKMIHEKVILLKVETEEVPHLQHDERVEVQDRGQGFYTATLHFGFMENVNVMRCLRLLTTKGVEVSLPEATFFLGRETLLPTNEPGMALWREHLFAFMSRNAQRAPTYFEIPAEQVIEIGFPLEI